MCEALRAEPDILEARGGVCVGGGGVGGWGEWGGGGSWEGVLS